MSWRSIGLHNDKTKCFARLAVDIRLKALIPLIVMPVFGHSSTEFQQKRNADSHAPVKHAVAHENVFAFVPKALKILVYSARKNITTNLCADMDDNNI